MAGGNGLRLINWLSCPPPCILRVTKLPKPLHARKGFLVSWYGVV
jgi:hypothetical protein